MSRISLICLVLLCCLSLFLSDVLCAPAYAAIDAYDPYDYVGDITVMGDEKKVTFDFTGLPWCLNIWENPGSIKTTRFGITGEAYSFRAANEASNNLTSRIFLCGQEQYEGQVLKSNNSIYIGDIMPGASVDIGMIFGLKMTHVGLRDSGYPLSVFFNYGFFMFDKDGKYLGNHFGYASNYEYPSNDVEEVTVYPSYQYTFSADVQYITPFLSWSASTDGSIRDWLFEFIPYEFTCSTYINMIYEDSITMDRIQNKLDDLNDGIQDANDKLDDVNQSIQDNGDKLDDVNQSIQDSNEKLDDIYTGGDAGASLGDAGDKLSGSSGTVSDTVGGMADDIGNVSDFETGQFEHIEYAFDQLAIVQEFGQFNTSLAFVSGYVQQIFDGLENWHIVLTLPMFIGLFFGICQHVGGISHVRSVNAREARAEELHEFRKDRSERLYQARLAHYEELHQARMKKYR